MKYQCPICRTHSAELFLRRDTVPVHQNVLFEKREQALNIARGMLSIVICYHCGFVFNVDFDGSLLSYDEKYENTQSYSPVFEKYLDDSIDYLVNKKGAKNCRIIEVGCGKGYFLRKLVEQGGNSGIGFDPSYIGPLELLDGKLRFNRGFYDEGSVDLVADIIICRHVIEHIANPLDMLGTIRLALANSPQAQVFFETPDVEWILKNQVVWDFFYEHCSYFSRPSIRLAFEKSGFLIDEIKNIFGGQYFWVEARPISEPNILALKDVEPLTRLAKDFEKANNKLVARWRAQLIKIKQNGKIAVWGAGAKGVTFANLFDPKQEMISCIIDVNPQKQNKYLPGTGHPIVNYEELIQRDIRTIIILNPNYRPEIEDLLKKSKINNIQIHEFMQGVNHEDNY